ncbi:hypothetical protein V6N12_020305 [Hibiscus sabdariffa]|uniref:Uncharacterized protein n=1 Tax=Hibiscus sabdariffa TaxID=183260 RepID=A0ABR2BUE5_9ROSI
MAQFKRPRDGPATSSLSLRFTWVVVWLFVENRLPVATVLVAIMSAEAPCSRTNLSCTMAGPGPMHGADPTARASRWPILDVGLVAWLGIVGRQLGAAPVVVTSATLSCCSSLHPTWRASLLLAFWFIWPVCAINLTARPSCWPHLGEGLAACLALGRLINVTLVVASLQPLWHVSPPFVLWSASPRSEMGLLGAALVAIPRWQIRGEEWLLAFVRFGSSARPLSWPFTWPDAKASMCPLQI